VNFLLLQALSRFARRLGDDYTVEFPWGSGQRRNLHQVVVELGQRLIGIFLENGGRRPVFGAQARFQDDANWRDALLFYEYFDGDTGAGLGASHQTGWTGLVADMIVRVSEARRAA
jgi:hypothetical protein